MNIRVLLTRPIFSLIFFSILSINSLATQNHLKLLSETSFASPREAHLIYENGMKLWQKLLEKEHFGTDVFSDNGRYSGIIKTVGDSIYLEINDDISAERYFHFIDDVENDKTIEFKSQLISQDINPLQILEVDYLKKLKEVAAFNLVPKEELWELKSQKILDDLQKLYKKLQVRWVELEIEAKTKELNFIGQYVNKNQVYIHISGVGKAELNSIDDHFFIRMVHEGSEISFALGNDDEIDFKGKHFKQYLARQHIDSGSHRGDQEKGRDFIFIRVKDIQENHHPELYNPKKYTRFNRPKRNSLKWWAKYRDATIKKVTISDFKFGAVCGMAQGVMTFCLATAVNSFVPVTEINSVSPAIFVTLWGTIFGVITPTIKNWADRGHPAIQKIKHMSNGILFQYGVTAFIYPGALPALFALDLSAFLGHLKIFTASLISNWAKPNLYNNVTIRTKAGLNRGFYTIGKFKTNIQQSNVERQKVYTPAFMFRFLERTNLGLPATIPAGTLVLLSTVPIYEYIFLRHSRWLAKKTNHPDVILMANQVQRQVDIKKKFFTSGTLRMLILKKYLYQLTFQRKAKNKILAKLSVKFPGLYTHRDIYTKSIDPVKVAPHEITPFEIPDLSKIKQQKNCTHTVTQNFIAPNHTLRTAKKRESVTE